MIVRTGLLVLALTLSLAVSACDKSESIRVENKSDQTVVVYEDGVPTELVDAGVTKEFSTLRFRGTLTYEIRYFCDKEVCDQSVLASRKFTWEQLQQTDGVTIAVP